MTRCLRLPLALVYPGLAEPTALRWPENWQKLWLNMPTEIKIKRKRRKNLENRNHR